MEGEILYSGCADLKKGDKILCEQCFTRPVKVDSEDLKTTMGENILGVISPLKGVDDE